MENKESKVASNIGAVSIGPGVFAALLAKASCPLCYPAIAGFLTSIGLGFLFEGLYFYIVVGLFISLSLFGLGFRARQRRGYAPLVLGLIAVCIGIIGEVYGQQLLFYLAVAILVCASVWNLIPAKKECGKCH